jgi:uncharacterized SAM-binding protein YcdF (DUF218 family)
MPLNTFSSIGAAAIPTPEEGLATGTHESLAGWGNQTVFMVKKILSLFLYPVPLGLAISILGLFCLWASQRQRLGKILVTLGTCVLLIFSFAFISGKILAPLERQYPALLHPEALTRTGERVSQSPKWVVVLGGGHVSDPRLPVTSQVSPPTLVRTIEGVRIYQALPGSKLLFSGGRVYDPLPEAASMAKIARVLGVNASDIILEPDSRDTADQAAHLAKVLGHQPFILVTSALHMPRAVALFKKYGMQPIPAPTNYLHHETQGFDPGRFLPQVGPLGQTTAALHEYLGLAWVWLRDLI